MKAEALEVFDGDALREAGGAPAANGGLQGDAPVLQLHLAAALEVLGVDALREAGGVPAANGACKEPRPCFSSV